MAKSGFDGKISVDIVKKLGVIGDNDKDFNLELRYISWNNRPPKYDLRGWKKNEDGTEMCGKGVTLTKEELIKLGEMINSINFDE